MFHSAKSQKVKGDNGRYDLKPHNLKNVDIVILWSRYENGFYIIPSEIIRGKIAFIANARSEYAQYINNWSILGESNNDNVDGTPLGTAGEYRVISELLSRGYSIFNPIIDNGCDLYIGGFKGIQVKTAKSYNATTPYIHKSYNFNLKASKQPNYLEGEEHHVKSHDLNGVDYIILWAIGDGFYIIPADKIRGSMSLQFTADHDKRTKVKWSQWIPYKNNWDVLKGIVPEHRVRKPFKCLKCQYEWNSYVPNPTRCPKCHTRWANDGVKAECHCKRCGNIWHTTIKPTWCPKCHTKLWDVEKVEHLIDKERAKALYLEGYSCSQIAKMLGFGTVTIWKVLKELNILRSRIEALKLSQVQRNIGEIPNGVNTE
jgi:predicted Zn-ribbon and HTH transcriptional regulator